MFIHLDSGSDLLLGQSAHSYVNTTMSVRFESHSFGELQRHVGSDLEILKEPNDPRFQEFAKRWSDIDRQTPAAIVLPESEEQIQKTVSNIVTLYWGDGISPATDIAFPCCFRSVGPFKPQCRSSPSQVATAPGRQSETTDSSSILASTPGFKLTPRGQLRRSGAVSCPRP